MRSLGDLFVRLGLDVSGFQNNMGLAQRSIGGLSTAMTALRTSFAVTAFATLISTFGGFAQGAAESELATTRLAQAITNAGESYERYRAQIAATINAGKRFGFNGTEQKDALAILVTQTDSTEEALKRLALAFDLARVTGQDLYTSARLLGKANDENATVLNRLGIVVRRGASEQEFFATVQAKVAGQAEAQSSKLAIAAQRLQNEFSDALKAAAGAVSGISPTFAALAIAFHQLGLQGVFATGVMGAMSATLKGLGVAALGAVRAIGAVTLALAPWAALAALGVALAAAVAKVGQALNLPILRQVGETFDQLGQIIEKIGVGGLLSGLAEQLLGLGRAAPSTVSAVDAAADALKRFSKEYEDMIDRLQAAGAFPGQQTFKQIEDAMSAFAKDMPNLSQALSQIKETMAGIRGLGTVEATQTIGAAIRANLVRTVNAEVESMENLRDSAKREIESVARFWADEADRRADFARMMADRARPVVETIDQLTKDMGAGFDAARRRAQAEATRARFDAETAELQRREAERISRLRPPETPTLAKVVAEFGSLDELDRRIAEMHERNAQVFTLLDELISGVVASQKKAIQEIEDAKTILRHPEVADEQRPGAIKDTLTEQERNILEQRQVGVPTMLSPDEAARVVAQKRAEDARVNAEAVVAAIEAHRTGERNLSDARLTVDVNINAPDITNLTPEAVAQIAREAFQKIAEGAEVIVRQMSGSSAGGAVLTP